MSDLFARQLEALRARSLDRHLLEISFPQGPIVILDGQQLINFSSNDYLGLAKRFWAARRRDRCDQGIRRRRKCVTINQWNAVAAPSTRGITGGMEKN